MTVLSCGTVLKRKCHVGLSVLVCNVFSFQIRGHIWKLILFEVSRGFVSTACVLAYYANFTKTELNIFVLYV